MRLELIKNALTRQVGRQVLNLKSHSPTLLFAGGVAGVVTSAVMASKATLKLEVVLEDAADDRTSVNEMVNKNYSEADRQRDHRIIVARTAVTVTKLYAPAVAVGVISIAALTGSHVVLTKRNTALMAAYSALDKGFNEYRSRVRDELGPEKDFEFHHGAKTTSELITDENGEERVEHKFVTPPGIPSPYARFFDDGSREWQRNAEYNRFFLHCQQRYANDKLLARGHVFLNEVYDALGLSRSKAGAVVGWILSPDGDNFIDFGIYDQDKQKSRMFVNGDEYSILLDFNVDGVIFDQLKDE